MKLTTMLVSGAAICIGGAGLLVCGMEISTTLSTPMGEVALQGKANSQFLCFALGAAVCAVGGSMVAESLRALRGFDVKVIQAFRLGI